MLFLDMQSPVNSPHNNPSKLWLFVVLILVGMLTWMGLSIAGEHYGIGPFAPTSTPTPTITPTPQNTPTFVPTARPQPEVVSKLEAASKDSFDITDVAVDAESIYVVIAPNRPFPDEFDSVAFDEAVLELIEYYSTGTQTSLLAMFLTIDVDTGDIYIAWVNTCLIETIRAVGASGAACTSAAVHVVVEDPATLRWLNS